MPRDNEHKIYKEKWACFECRKCFKQRFWLEWLFSAKSTRNMERVVHCPQCRQPMTNMGWDFKVPKQKDIEQWKKAELLVQNGFKFQSYCYWNESHKWPGPCPARLSEVEEFLENEKQKLAKEKR